MNFQKPKYKTLIIICIIGGIFYSIFLLHRWVASEISQTDRSIVDIAKDKVKELFQKEKKKRYRSRGEVVRHQKYEPNRQFAESRFLLNDKEIAGFNSQEERIFDERGEIPDGKVKFIDHSENRYGYENYRFGKRHGEYVEYYDNGVVYRKARYYHGKEMLNKVYFYDGTLRMVEDRTDALIAIEDSEAGKGRVFRRDGSMLYEWELTNAMDGGYKISYNRYGEVVQIKYYNAVGEVTQIKNF